MTDKQIDFVKRCIADNNIHRFYLWKTWKRKRLEVLELDHHECQDCKAKGIYTKATIVHHNQFVRKHPDLALEINYQYQGKTYRNLISLCHACHEERHDRNLNKNKKEKFTNVERWD